MTFQVIQMAARTLSWWRDERGDVDLDPVYQRKGHIWNERQKQYLIDSILNGFDIPKLYVADFTFLNSQMNTSKKKYAVIDGKQRLLAIYDFFDDELTLPKDFSYIDDPSLNLAGYSYSDLLKNHPKIARRFDNSSLTVMSVITDDESKINDLFVRLNSSKPLTGAELRNAMGGKLPEIIRDLISHKFFTTLIKFNVSRSQDKNTAAKLLLLEHRGSIVDTKKHQLDALVKEAGESETTIDNEIAGDNEESAELEDALLEIVENTENPDVGRSAERVKHVLDKLAGIFIPTDPLLRQQAQIVIIYWIVRDLEQELLAKVRPFLLEFEALREENKRMPQQLADTELAEYELMARTSNDAFSIRRRTQILQQRFEKFTKLA